LPRASKKIKRKGRMPASERVLLNLLKGHLSKDFPNPRRRGCPPKETLARIARKPLTGPSSVVRHLFQCSPCYRLYSRALHRSKTTYRKIL